MLFAAVLAATLAAPTEVAVARCNNYNATHLEDQVRAFDRRPPNAADRDARFTALRDVVSSADEEAGILHAVCGESDFAPLAGQLLAVQAWALALESDLDLANYATHCTAAAKPVAQALIGNAWLLLVRADPAQQGKYPTVQTVKPKVVSRAADLGLTLPAPPDTSVYWVTQLQQAGTAAVSACQQ